MDGNLRIIFAVSGHFPQIGVRGSYSTYAPKFGADPKKYASFAFIAPILPAFFLSILLFFTASFPLLPSFLLIYALLAFFMILLPKLAFGRIRGEVEAELPLFLRTLGMLLELNIPFHNALERISKEDFAVSPYVGDVVQEIKRGATVESSLMLLANEFGSLSIKRAISQLICAYESGEGATAILKISNDLSLLGQHKMKEFSSKQALFSLLFIAVSTILPAVFLIFSILGTAIFSSETEPLAFSLAFLLGFPALSALILYASSFSSPARFMENKSGGPGILPPLLIASFSILLSLSSQDPFISIIMLSLILLSSIVYFYPKHKAGKYRESVEAGLPDALLSASGASRGKRMESIFSLMQKSSNRELSRELSISLKQLRANIKPAKVLEDLWSRNDSIMLRRVSTFFSQLFDSGANVHNYTSLMAEDLFCLFEIRRERQNALSMQKYTLIFGALILPVILGNSLSLIAGISETAGDDSLLQAAYSAIPAYLIIYAFLSSAFIAEAESRSSSLLTYFTSLSIASTILFYLFVGTLSL